MPNAVLVLSELRARGVRAVLHVAGRDPSGNAIPQLRSLADELGVGAAVHLVGAVPDDVLGHLYNDSDVVYMPSLSEGFGLPAVEAMAFGVPVVGHDGSALSEVIGDAGLLVDSSNLGAAADAIVRAALEPAVRARLIARGTDRVADLSIDRVAQRYADLFDLVAARAR
jgi:glycosyltransferase involved in cell wall biosynthesis